MNTKRIGSGMRSLISVLIGAGFLVGFSISHAQDPSLIKPKEIQSDNSGKVDPDNPPPVLPPTHDSEMVIKPDVPPDPDAIITPPVVDPEMAVDPTTREPMSREDLENLQKVIPEQRERGIPNNK